MLTELAVITLVAATPGLQDAGVRAAQRFMPDCSPVILRYGSMGGKQVGLAELGKCRVTVRRQLWRGHVKNYVCAVVTHEFGHLDRWRDPVTGGVHHRLPGRVMSRVIKVVPPTC